MGLLTGDAKFLVTSVYFFSHDAYFEQGLILDQALPLQSWTMSGYVVKPVNLFSIFIFLPVRVLSVNYPFMYYVSIDYTTLCISAETPPVQVRIEVFETVKARNRQLQCEVETFPRHAPITRFYWLTTDYGKTRAIPYIANPANAASVNRKFAYTKDASTSVLVIKDINERDITNYTCIAAIKGGNYTGISIPGKLGERDACFANCQ